MSAGETARLSEARRGSEAWKAKHAQILAAALGEFIERGFNGASMDRIASKAKVSKVTIYNHFENKDLLYRQTVNDYLTQVHPGFPPVEAASGVEPREILVGYCKRVVGTISGARSIGMIRLLRADPDAFTEPTYAAGEARLLPDAQALAAYLALEARHGRLKVARPELAARQLLGMLLENTVYPLLLGVRVELTRPAIDELVETCVATFLSYYGASVGAGRSS